MIIVKVLGVIDILTALFFWLSAMFGIFSGAATIFAFILLAKGIFFMISLDFASILDVIVSFFIFASFAFTFPLFLVTVITLYLLVKGGFSLL